jgi:WD40 repeat protein
MSDRANCYPENIPDWLDAAADQFEYAWRAGPRPHLADHLGTEAGERRRALLAELVRIDLDYRWQAGEQPKLEDYLPDFPELLGSDRSLPDDLVLYADRVRSRHVGAGGRAKAVVFVEAGRTVLDLRCPHCGSPVHLDDEFPCEVICRNCGSSFRIEPDAPPSLRPADLPKTLGRFQLLELLGRGSFGAVYKARDAQLDRSVAIKVPRAGYFSAPEEQQRFWREARSAAQLRHPNIVPVHEIAQEGELPYLVSDYIEGRTLAAVLAERRPGVRAAAELTAQIADALAYAHGHKVIHRDINPRNILIDSAGRPFVTDFGLARRGDGEMLVTVEGQVLGTPAYMAPEQAAGEVNRVDGRSDIYGLGVVLYELLTGELPFRGSLRQLLGQVIHDEPRPPRRLNDHVPHDLETICLKAMAKSPARRYATAGDLAADLRRYLRGEPIHARPVGNAGRLWSWCRRNPLLALALAAVAVSLLAGTGAGTYFAAQAEARRRETRLEQQQVIVHQQNTQEMGRLRALAEEQRALVRRHLYFSRVNMADRAWHEGHIARMDDLLAAELPSAARQEDFRGFEWHYLWRLRHANQFTVAGRGTIVESVAFSPDGKYLTSGSGTTDLWRVHASKPGLTLARRWDSDSRAVAFSPDGRHLASGNSWPGHVRLWDVQTGKRVFSMPGHTRPITSVAFSPDGRCLASASEDRTVKVWDAASGRELFTLKGHTDKVTQVAFSPDGRRLASASKDRAIKVWDAATGQELQTARGHTQPISGVVYRPDGRRFASGAGDQTLRVWNAATAKEVLTIHTVDTYRAAFSPDGRRVAAVSVQAVQVWDADTGQALFALKGHMDEVIDVAFSPDGRRLASGARDGTVKLWEAVPQPEAQTIPWPDQLVRSVAFSPDGRRLAGGAGDRTVRVWDAATGRELMILKGHADEVRGVAFSPDGRRLASASNDRTVKVWDAGTGAERLTLRGHGDRVVSVDFSPDGTRLASGAEDKDATIRIWDAGTGRELLTYRGHAGRASAAFSPDGERLASAGEDGTVKIWDARTGREFFTFKDRTSPYGSMTRTAWSPDGRRLAVGSSGGAIPVWDTSSGQAIKILKGHTGYVCSVAFSPDGRRLASSSFDKRVKIWDVATGQEALTLAGHARTVQCVAFSPDGGRLASASGDGTIKIWDARPLTLGGE